MALAAGQICAEMWKHSPTVWFVYQPTGRGDWYRWRLATAKIVNDSRDNTHPCLAGVLRGRVYAGSSVAFSGSSAASGFSSTAAYMGVSFATSSDVAHYRDYARPENMTHCRAMMRCVTTSRDIVVLSAMNDAGDVLGTVEYNTASGIFIGSTPWLALPAGTTKVRVKKKTADATQVHLIGVDWINTASEVSPDTAGSIMFDGSNGTAQTVMTQAHWDLPFATAPSIELALFWNDVGQPYNSVYAVGGIGHQGIKTATVAWQTQSGTDAPATWAPSQGDKSAGVDYLIVSDTATAYLETVGTNARGTFAGLLVFDASGVLIDQRVTPSQDMSVFQMFTSQLTTPLDVSRVLFDGDTQWRVLTAADKGSTIKTAGMQLWGGASRTLYTLRHQRLDNDLAYYQNVSSAWWPRVTYAAGVQRKCYIMEYANTTTPFTLASGTVIGTRFKIGLQDQSIIKTPSFFVE